MTTFGRILLAILVGAILSLLVFLHWPWLDSFSRAMWAAFSFLTYIIAKLSEDLS